LPDRVRATAPIDLQEVTTRNRIARQLAENLAMEGKPAASPPAGIWRQLAATFADTPALAAEITRLRTDLAGTRLDHANLAAAALAAIAAHDEGEPDPLSYLRDELHAQGYDPRGRR
jgi:hypothetical protein